LQSDLYNGHKVRDKMQASLVGYKFLTNNWNN